MEIAVACPYCGEALELWVDQSGGSAQRYVEDCTVCCQPMAVSVTIDEEDDCSVSVARLDD